MKKLQEVEDDYVKRLERELDEWFNGTSRNYTDIAKYYWANELIYQLDMLDDEDLDKIANIDILLKLADDILDDDYMWSSINDNLHEFIMDEIKK